MLVANQKAVEKGRQERIKFIDEQEKDEEKERDEALNRSYYEMSNGSPYGLRRRCAEQPDLVPRRRRVLWWWRVRRRLGRIRLVNAGTSAINPNNNKRSRSCPHAALPPDLHARPLPPIRRLSRCPGLSAERSADRNCSIAATTARGR